ncbi:MAG TPA: hypothetical protein VJS43_07065 [Candidatus Acidoferrales bacterium]|nr:hypothetical protein [Candidatus Acidoferrales bacterium]
MSRFIYCCLIRLHPREFRERFGDEMLCVFDEAQHAGEATFLADGVGSLARQWVLRSGLWRWAIGAGFTALLIGSIVHWEAKGVKAAEIQFASQQRHPTPLNQAEFNREAADAVAMLARFRASDKKKSHSSHSQQSTAPDETTQD